MPTSWTNREAGHSKLQLKEMGSRYLFIVLYVFLEQHLTRGDYRRRGDENAARPIRTPSSDQAGHGHGSRLERLRRTAHGRRLGG